MHLQESNTAAITKVALVEVQRQYLVIIVHWQYVLQYKLLLFYIILCIIVLSLENKHTINIQYNNKKQLET